MSGIERRLTLGNLAALALAVLAVPRAMRAIRRRRARVVIGGGGIRRGAGRPRRVALRIPCC